MTLLADPCRHDHSALIKALVPSPHPKPRTRGSVCHSTHSAHALSMAVLHITTVTDRGNQTEPVIDACTRTFLTPPSKTMAAVSDKIPARAPQMPQDREKFGSILSDQAHWSVSPGHDFGTSHVPLSVEQLNKQDPAGRSQIQDTSIVPDNPDRATAKTSGTVPRQQCS